MHNELHASNNPNLIFLIDFFKKLVNEYIKIYSENRLNKSVLLFIVWHRRFVLYAFYYSLYELYIWICRLYLMFYPWIVEPSFLITRLLEPRLLLKNLMKLNFSLIKNYLLLVSDLLPFTCLLFFN